MYVDRKKIENILRKVYTQGYNDKVKNLPPDFSNVVEEEWRTFVYVLEERCEKCGLVKCVDLLIKSEIDIVQKEESLKEDTYE